MKGLVLTIYAGVEVVPRETGRQRKTKDMHDDLKCENIGKEIKCKRDREETRRKSLKRSLSRGPEKE